LNRPPKWRFLPQQLGSQQLGSQQLGAQPQSAAAGAQPQLASTGAQQDGARPQPWPPNSPKAWASDAPAKTTSAPAPTIDSRTRRFIGKAPKTKQKGRIRASAGRRPARTVSLVPSTIRSSPRHR
jgi:hypothetical protein